MALWLHPAGFQDRLLDRFVVVVVIGWLALAADTGGELLKVADVTGDVLDRNRLPAGLVAGPGLEQAEAHRRRLERLHHSRALAPADHELPALARSDLQRGAFEDGEGPTVEIGLDNLRQSAKFLREKFAKHFGGGGDE